MAFYEWTEKLSVMVDAFDEHHKDLINLINELHSAMLKGKGDQVLDEIFTELLEYTDYHFKSEEKIFEKYGYPDTKSHKAEHESFIQKVKEHYNRFKNKEMLVSIQLLTILGDWITNHINKTDKNYSEFLKDKDVTVLDR